MAVFGVGSTHPQPKERCMSENDDIEVVEAYTQDLTEDGSVVAEEIIAAVNLETGEAVIDDIVEVIEPDGSGFEVVVDEVEVFEAE
jgi:hypothetical protein